MRDIVTGLHMSLDGVAESADKWVFPYIDDELGQAIGAAMAASDAILVGRKTYQEFAAHWPTQTGDIANYMNNTPKLVVSTTLDKVEWQNSTLIRSDVAGELTRLKQQPGKNINIVGSPTLVRSLLREGLIDQLQLLVYPIVVGSGKRLFESDGKQVPLKLLDATTFSTGALRLTYEPVSG